MLIKNNRGLVEGTFKLCMENSWFNEKLKSTVWSSNFNSAFFLSRLNLVFNPHGRTSSSSSCSYERGVWNVNSEIYFLTRESMSRCRRPLGRCIRNKILRSANAKYHCPTRNFAQKAKSRGGTLVASEYIMESTYSWLELIAK